MDYYSELERALRAFQLLPRKLSEENIRMLGALNHFETFEEEDVEVAPGVRGKRISLSGSIVVLDLDFVREGDAQKVVGANVSLSNETPPDAPGAAMAAAHHPSEHVLASLKEPRLDRFGRILGVLSNCDRLSTKDVDCFKALALVAEAVFARERAHPGEFPPWVMNPPHCLGLAFEYAPRLLAFLDIRPGSRSQFCLRSFTSLSQWINAEGEWVDDGGRVDSRAELCLTLDPPVVLSDDAARALEAEPVRASRLDARRRAGSFSVPRHPRFAAPGHESDEFDVTVGNMLPFHLVEVAQIPLRAPSEIPNVLAQLRQFATAAALVDSVMQPGEMPPTTEAAELNIADALALRSQPVFSKSIPLSVAWHSIGTDLEIAIVWAITELQLTVTVPLNGDLSVKVTPPDSRLNLGDVEKLLRAGRLDLALSYAVAGSGRLHRRSTNKPGQ